MKPVGLLAASLTLVFLGAAAAADKDKDPPLPGFPDITSNVKLFEQPLGTDNKPLLKIVKAEYDVDRRLGHEIDEPVRAFTKAFFQPFKPRVEISQQKTQQVDVHRRDVLLS